MEALHTSAARCSRGREDNALGWSMRRSDLNQVTDTSTTRLCTTCNIGPLCAKDIMERFSVHGD